ncbi:MAG: SDR family oxidoreductase, partial [Terriglobales bacterium]
LSGTGVNVNVVTPGFTASEATLSDGQERFGRANELSLNRRIIKRTEEPSDLSGTIAFLASDAADFITGQTFNCDGGAYLH